MHCHKGRHFTHDGDILKLIPFVFNEQNSLLKVNPTSEHDTLQSIHIHFGENLIKVTQDYRIDLLAAQEVRWLGRSIEMDCRIYYSCDDENIFGAGIIVSKYIRSRVNNFKPIDMRLGA
jgi:hypothetical protein